eukprot:CAMPEP_0184643346 /NCGR_PEP_ID=MMETSP0308-20130426/181_1 /TAXON_ID=38269 /ORGANISM="Gloeochaete witrockiana, Strain SAG 46.84" /LENGTH=65 /DNA_ID=CAMNT_0027071223 /DNA_START=121 /DNA_END=315 /DNA_ORIENTATION=+
MDVYAYKEFDETAIAPSVAKWNRRKVICLEAIFAALFVYMTYTIIDTCITNNLIAEWNYLGSIKW